jgi:hypothetical protein
MHQSNFFYEEHHELNLGAWIREYGVVGLLKLPDDRHVSTEFGLGAISAISQSEAFNKHTLQMFQWKKEKEKNWNDSVISSKQPVYLRYFYQALTYIEWYKNEPLRESYNIQIISSE